MVRRYDTYRWSSGGLVQLGWASLGFSITGRAGRASEGTARLAQAVVVELQVDSRNDLMDGRGTGTRCGRNDYHRLFGPSQSFQSLAGDVGPWLCTARRHRAVVSMAVFPRALLG